LKKGVKNPLGERGPLKGGDTSVAKRGKSRKWGRKGSTISGKKKEARMRKEKRPNLSRGPLEEGLGPRKRNTKAGEIDNLVW